MTTIHVLPILPPHVDRADCPCGTRDHYVGPDRIVIHTARYQEATTNGNSNRCAREICEHTPARHGSHRFGPTACRSCDCPGYVAPRPEGADRGAPAQPQG